MFLLQPINQFYKCEETCIICHLSLRFSLVSKSKVGVKTSVDFFRKINGSWICELQCYCYCYMYCCCSDLLGLCEQKCVVVARTCWACVNKSEAKTTRPSLHPTSCMWWVSTHASCELTGGSSRLLSTNSLSSCTVSTPQVVLRVEVVGLVKGYRKHRVSSFHS